MQNTLIITECLINRDGGNPWGFIHTLSHQSQTNRKKLLSVYQRTGQKCNSHLNAIWGSRGKYTAKKSTNNLRKHSETHADTKRTEIHDVASKQKRKDEGVSKLKQPRLGFSRSPVM